MHVIRLRFNYWWQGCSNREPWNRGAVSNRRKISVFRLFLRDLYGLSSPISLAERVSALQTHVLWFNVVTFWEIRNGFFDFATMSRSRRVTLMLTYLPSQLLTMIFIVASYGENLGQYTDSTINWMIDMTGSREKELLYGSDHSSRYSVIYKRYVFETIICLITKLKLPGCNSRRKDNSCRITIIYWRLWLRKLS